LRSADKFIRRSVLDRRGRSTKMARRRVDEKGDEDWRGRSDESERSLRPNVGVQLNPVAATSTGASTTRATSSAPFNQCRRSLSSESSAIFSDFRAAPPT
jgi:hypothetical protein